MLLGFIFAGKGLGRQTAMEWLGGTLPKVNTLVRHGIFH